MGATDQATGGRFLSLLAGQKNVFEQIARGAELADVLTALAHLVEAHASEPVRASVLLVDEDGTHLVHGAAPSLPDEYNAAIHGIAIGPSVGSCGTAAHRGETVVVTDIATDPLWDGYRDLALPHGLRACWSAPVLTADGRVLGTFAVYASAPAEPAEEDLAMLATFAQTAAVAIERHRDLMWMLREQRNARALQEVGQAIAQRIELGEIVQLATDAATELTHAQFGAFSVPQDAGACGPAFDGTRTVRIADLTAGSGHGDKPLATSVLEGHGPVRSYLSVPVTLATGEVAGGLFFGHAEPGVFGVEAERLAEGIAVQAAIGIQNARVYEERDRVLRSLQESLLPPRLPTVPGLDVAAGYRPAGEGVELVGDFYDVFPRSATRWSVVIGDVCGKGIEAAKLTGLARHTVRAAAMHADSPAEVLGTLNDAILLEPGEPTFLTAAYLEIDTTERPLTVCLCCAGHPPVLIRGADGTVRGSRHHGQLLGPFEDPELQDEAHVLAPGDVVLLVTDGVVEARRGRELFGEQRLRDALAACPAETAAQVVSAVVDAVADHADAITDDVAIVALRVPPDA